MKTITLTDEFVNQIVIDELKEALTIMVEDDSAELKDIEALKRTLMYFATRSDYEPFLRNLALTQMVRENERLGLYDE